MERCGTVIFKGSIVHNRVAKNQFNYNYVAAVSMSINYQSPSILIEEDLEFGRRTEIALNEISEGHGIEMNGVDFLKELETW